MDRIIDDVARILATSMPRRKALGLVGGVFATAFFAMFAVEPLEAKSCTKAQLKAGARSCKAGDGNDGDDDSDDDAGGRGGHGGGDNGICCPKGTCCAAKGNKLACCAKGSCVCDNGTCAPSGGGKCPHGCSRC